ncbi:MAG: hypothetical protein ACT4O5_11200 [Gammaproteobacteria bacterium]
MARASNVSYHTATGSSVTGRMRTLGCVRVRFRPFTKARNVCRIKTYMRVSPCARSRVERFTVHWFDPWLARMTVVAGRMH